MAELKRIVNLTLPVTACNLNCHYCFVGQEGGKTGEFGILQYSSEHIQSSLTKDRLGGVCFISVCGLGETLLPDYSVDIITRMLENGHFVSVVTNGTITSRIKELCELDAALRQRLFFKFSFHYLELKRKNLLERFWENIHMVKAHGVAFTLELMASDESVPYIDEIRELCQKEVLADCHIAELRNNADGFSRLTNFPVHEHQARWRNFNSPFFEFQQEIWSEKRREFCYAGEWMINVDAGSGWTVPCLGGGSLMQNILEDPNEPIRFFAIGKNCPWKHCYCGYVTLAFGIIPDFSAPCHSEFRDRICRDGTTWLTPKIRDFFSRKLNEANKEYSIEKKLYINTLMALEYGNTDEKNDCGKVVQTVATALLSKGIRTIAVWGYNRYSEWLFEVLKSKSVKLRYVVDTEFYAEWQPNLVEKLKRRYKYAIKRLVGGTDKPLLLNRYDNLPQVDAMVTTDWAHFTNIRQQIPFVYKHLLSITQLADRE